MELIIIINTKHEDNLQQGSMLPRMQKRWKEILEGVTRERGLRGFIKGRESATRVA